MKVDLNVNGLLVETFYTEETVEEVFRPLLRHWARLYREKKRPVLILLGAPPAMGKSTLTEFLAYLMKTQDPETEGLRLTPLGMDGFHYFNEYLLSHYGMREGKAVLLKDIKGSPETFRAEELAAKLWEIREGKTVRFPYYDRKLHDPVEEAIPVEGEIILVEGNYLLLDEPRWEMVREPADETVFVEAEAESLRERLVSRKALGIGRAAAEEFVDRSDMNNVRLCLEKRAKADITLRAEGEGKFIIKDGKL